MDGSFWAGGFDVGSGAVSIEEVLSQPNPSLESVLSHPDVISECKYLNADLIEYLSTKATIEKLVRLIITPPPPSLKEDTKEREKFDNPSAMPYIASEIFACEVMDILNVFFEHQELLHLLFAFLDQRPPLVPGNCAYFCKLCVGLITKKHFQILQFIQAHNILDKILNHIGVYSIMELLIRIGWDDGSGGATEYDDNESMDPAWLERAQLVNKLVEKLNPKHENEPEVHANATCALVDAVVKSSPMVPCAMVLVANLQSKPVLDVLFGYMFSGSPSSLTHTLSVAIVLVQSYTDRRLQERPTEEEGARPHNATIVEHVVTALPKLLDILRHPAQQILPVQYGTLNPPCGPSRLKIVELVLALVRCVAEDESAMGADKATELITNKLAETNAFSFVLDVFAQYPWNNLLHGLVEAIIHSVLDVPQENEEPTEEQSKTTALAVLRKNFFASCKLLARIAGFFQQNADALSKPKACRLGFMGHLMRVTTVLRDSFPIAALAELGLTPEEVTHWQQLLEGRFFDDYKTQQIVLGGHRPGAFGQRPPEPEAQPDSYQYGGMMDQSSGFLEQPAYEDDDDDDDFFNWEPRSTQHKPDSDSDEDTREVDPDRANVPFEDMPNSI